MTPTLHRCTSCRERKPPEQFYGSHRAKCKECLLEAAHVRRVKNKARKPLQRVLPPPGTPNTYKPSKAPQNRSKGPKKRPKRTRIRAFSKKKREWKEMYSEKLLSETLFGDYYDLMGESVVRKVGSRMNCDPHHPAGRNKYHLLVFRWVTPALHRAIHDRGRWSREHGLILPQLEGRESGPDQLDPFSVLPQLQELRKKYEL